MLCTGVVFFFPRVFVGTGFVIVFAPQAQGFRQVRGVASRAGHRNETHLDLIIITDLFLKVQYVVFLSNLLPQINIVIHK